MMPLGSQNSGGRSSSLSPLAPPFTLNKPYRKQHNSKPPMNFTEPCDPCFDRPRPVWSPPVNSTSGPSSTEIRSKDGRFPPQDVHGFPGSQPNSSSSSSTRLAPLNNALGSVGYDGSSYGQYSDSIPTTLAEAKLYYSPYAVSDDLEMAACKEPNYDLLSNFSLAQQSGTSQVDDTRTVSAVKYTPQWNSIWNGLNAVEQDNWLDLGGNYASKDHKPPEASIRLKGTRKGYDAGGDHYDFHVSTLPAGSLGSYAETSIKSTDCFDGFGGENSFGSPSIEDCKSFKEPNTTSIRLSVLGSEMPQVPFLYHRIPSNGFREGPLDSQDKQTHYSGSYVLDSTSAVRSPPANKNKVTFGRFPSPQYAAPSATVDSVRNEAMDKNEKSPDFLPYHPFGLNFNVSNYAGNTDSLFTASPSNKIEANINKKQVNDDSFDHSLSTVPHLSMPECLKIKADSGDTFYSMDKYSDGTDIQNPAEDSPCWKGARFSPFEDSKMVIPDIVLEMSESCFKQNGEEEQMNSPTRLYTTDGTDTTHVIGEVNGSHASKRSSYLKSVSRDRDGSCSMVQGLHSAKPFGEDGVQSFDKKGGPELCTRNDIRFLNYSGVVSSSIKPQPLRKKSEGCDILPEETDAELKGNNLADGLFSSPTNAGDETFHSPSRNVAASMNSQLSGKDLTPKVDIKELLHKMTDLSELLVSQCNSHDRSTEVDHGLLKHIISNLNSCLVKKADQSTQTEKSQDLQPDSSCAEGSPQAQMAIKATPASIEQHENDFFGSWKSSSVKGNETVRDAETTQALKSALEMNFPSEEMQPETILYKNLWLEAEAALCAATIKSRFNRWKKEAEKEKRGYQPTNEEDHVPISKPFDANKATGSSHNEANDSPSSDMDSSVIARFRTLRSVAEDPKSPNLTAGRKRPSLETESTQMPTFSSPQSQASDFEAPIMARFQTLMSRADYTDPESPENEKSLPVADPDSAYMSLLNILKSRSLDSSNAESVTGSKDRKFIGLGNEILEGWYDCSEPGWEHVTKEGP